MNFYKALVSDIMITDVMTVDRHLTALKALEIMIRKGIDQLPVIEDDRLVGMIT